MPATSTTLRGLIQALGLTSRNRKNLQMEHFKNFTLQQLIIATCCSAMVAGIMLSHESKIGYFFLAVSVTFGLGALAKSISRK